MPTNAQDSWAPGPDHPLLGDRAVHVWRADLTTLTDDLCGLLCSEERARAERVLRVHDRQLWMRSRGVLRALLGRYLDKDPSTLRFASGAHGKPALLDAAAGSAAGPQPQPGGRARVSFNLSHSGGLALYAVTPTVAVGVDVELARRPVEVLAVAARTFGAAEAERLRALDPATREQEFLRAWVRHEAALKCLGVGIGGADAAGDESRPWIAELEIGPRAAAAVAVETPPGELRCWDWPPRPARPVS
ncbi:MAG: 4'-phosphopantetheinyl transferase superfamily protein [Solirubrobacteraceae bacterium]|jgi:4'-phosphopantetheinyl transferase